MRHILSLLAASAAAVALVSETTAQTGAPKEEVREVRAHSIDGNSDRKEIHIPEGWEYWNHSVAQWTANPKLTGGNPYWSRTDGVVRDAQGRIVSVYVAVQSVGRLGLLNFGPRNWIGVDLKVTLRRR